MTLDEGESEQIRKGRKGQQQARGQQNERSKVDAGQRQGLSTPAPVEQPPRTQPHKNGNRRNA